MNSKANSTERREAATEQLESRNSSDALCCNEHPFEMTKEVIMFRIASPGRFLSAMRVFEEKKESCNVGDDLE